MARLPSPSRRGGAAIETALLLPLLCSLFCAFLEFGWVFFQRGQLSRIVRDGCRVAALDTYASAPHLRAAEAIRADLAARHLMCEPPDCVVSTLVSGTDVNDRVLTCTAIVPLDPLTGFLPVDRMKIRGGTTMRLEWRGTR